MRLRDGLWRNVQVSFVLSTVLIASACGVPEHMELSTGLRPENVDRDVRFRTTYYFRTFDYCTDQQGMTAGRPNIDSVYRFRLTGKSHSLTTQMHFESGFLDADQIDPFGANVAFDEENRHFYFKSQQKVEQEAEREGHLKQAQRLLTLYAETEADLRRIKEPGQQLTVEDNNLLSAIKVAATSHLNRLNLDPPVATPSAPDQASIEDIKDQPVQKEPSVAGGVQPASQSGSTPQELTGSDPKPTQGANRNSGECRDLARGLQILGPQGWETFDQDKRLIFAVSSSAQPIISTLQELSGRILDANAPGAGDLLVPLLREEMRISEAEARLSTFDPAQPDQASGLIGAALTAMQNSETAQKSPAQAQAVTIPQPSPSPTIETALGSLLEDTQ